MKNTHFSNLDTNWNKLIILPILGRDLRFFKNKLEKNEKLDNNKRNILMKIFIK
jgi:hypothetical protein